MNDSDFISEKNFRYYCSTNEKQISGKIKGIVLEFPGYGGGSCLGGNLDFDDYATPYSQKLADNGLLLIYTKPGPWSWMNKGAVRICDLIEDAAIKAFSLDENIPTVATGGSMGGLGSLIFSARSRHNIIACVAACPCCDVLKFFESKPIFPRGFISAISAYDMPFEDALKSISPIENIDTFRNIPYYIVGDCDDDCFDISNTDFFISEMKKRGFSVDYRKLPEKKHGEFTPDAWDGMEKFIINSFSSN